MSKEKLGDVAVGSIVELPSGPGSRNDQVRILSHDGQNTTVRVVRSGDTGNLITERDGIELKRPSSERLASSQKNSSSGGSSSSRPSSGSSDFGVSRGDSMAHSSFESARASGDFTGSKGAWNSFHAAHETSKK